MASRAGDQTSLRRRNAAAVLRAVRGGDHPTLRELAAGTGLSRPTVESALETLRRDGLVLALPPASGGVGRPARRYRFRAEAQTVLGLELGAHHVRALAADLDGEVGGEARLSLPARCGAQERLDAARQAADAALRDAGSSPEDVAAAGAGTPGVLREDGTVAMSVLPGWTGLALSERLTDALGYPTRADNDANLAVLGERWRGCAGGVRDAVFVLLAQDIGAGVLIGGRLHRGAHGAAGEIAQQDFIGNLPAIARLDAQTVAAAADGDGAALDLVRTAVPHIADYVTALTLVIDPEVVVIGGALTSVAEHFRAEVERALARSALPGPRLAVSTTGERAVALGAVRLALDAVDAALKWSPD